MNQVWGQFFSCVNLVKKWISWSEDSSCYWVNLVKKWIRYEDSSFPVSTSLKNESVGYVGRLEISSFLGQFLLLCQPRLKNETCRWGQFVSCVNLVKKWISWSEDSSFYWVKLIKKWIRYEDNSFPVSTSLKNESVGLRIVPVTESTSLKNELGMRTVLFLCQPH